MTDLRGSSSAQESTGGCCAAADLKGSSRPQGSRGETFVADCCCASHSCKGVTQCGMS